MSSQSQTKGEETAGATTFDPAEHALRSLLEEQEAAARRLGQGFKVTNPDWLKTRESILGKWQHPDPVERMPNDEFAGQMRKLVSGLQGIQRPRLRDMANKLHREMGEGCKSRGLRYNDLSEDARTRWATAMESFEKWLGHKDFDLARFDRFVEEYRELAAEIISVELETHRQHLIANGAADLRRRQDILKRLGLPVASQGNGSESEEEVATAVAQAFDGTSSVSEARETSANGSGRKDRDDRRRPKSSKAKGTRRSGDETVAVEGGRRSSARPAVDPQPTEGGVDDVILGEGNRVTVVPAAAQTRPEAPEETTVAAQA